MADPPRLHIPVAQQSFKRSFEEFGFDLDSPQESNINEASGSGSGAASGSGSGANHGGNGNNGGSERSKRQRSDDPNASTSDGGSEYMSFSASEASDSFVSLPAGPSERSLSGGAGPSNLSTVWSPPDLDSHWEDVDMLSASLPAEPLAGPSTSAAQPAGAVAREDEEPNSFQRSIERFNEFNSNISIIRPSRSRPSSPPPVLPPLSLPPSELEPVDRDDTATPEPESSITGIPSIAEMISSRSAMGEWIRARRRGNPRASFHDQPLSRSSSPGGSVSRTSVPRPSSATRVRFAETAPVPVQPFERASQGPPSTLDHQRTGERGHDAQRDGNIRSSVFTEVARRSYASFGAPSSSSSSAQPSLRREGRGSPSGEPAIRSRIRFADSPPVDNETDEEVDAVVVADAGTLRRREELEAIDEVYALMHEDEARQDDASRPPRLPSPDVRTAHERRQEARERRRINQAFALMRDDEAERAVPPQAIRLPSPVALAHGQRQQDQVFALVRALAARRESEEASRPPRLPSPAVSGDHDSDFEEILFRGPLADHTGSTSTLSSSESRRSSSSASLDGTTAGLLARRHRERQAVRHAGARSSQGPSSSGQAAMRVAFRTLSESPSPTRSGRRVSFVPSPAISRSRSPSLSARAPSRTWTYSDLPSSAGWVERSQRTDELLGRVNTVTNTLRQRRAQLDAEVTEELQARRLRDRDQEERDLWLERVHSRGPERLPMPEPLVDSDESDIDREVQEYETYLRRRRRPASARPAGGIRRVASGREREAPSGSRDRRDVRVPTPPPVLEDIGVTSRRRADSGDSSFEQLMADWTTPAPGLVRLERSSQSTSDRSSGLRSAPPERTRSPSISPIERFEAFVNRDVNVLHRPPPASASEEFVRSTHGDAMSPPRLDFRDEPLSPPLAAVLPELSPELDEDRRVHFRTPSTPSRMSFSDRHHPEMLWEPRENAGAPRERPSSSASMRPPTLQGSSRGHRSGPTPFVPPPRPSTAEDVTRSDDHIIHPLLRRRSTTRNTAGRPTTQPASSARHRPPSVATLREMLIPELDLDDDWAFQSESAEWGPEVFPLSSASELRRRSMNSAPRRSSPQRTSPSVSRNAVHIAHHPRPLSPISVVDDGPPPLNFVEQGRAARESMPALSPYHPPQWPRSSTSRSASEMYARAMRGDPPSSFFSDASGSNSSAPSESRESGSRTSDPRRRTQVRDPFPRGYGERIPAPGSAEARRLRSSPPPAPPPPRRRVILGSSVTATRTRSAAVENLDELIGRSRRQRLSAESSNAAQSGEAPPSLPPLPTLDVDLNPVPSAPTEPRSSSSMDASPPPLDEPLASELRRGQERHQQRIREMQEAARTARMQAMHAASELRQRYPPTTSPSGEADEVHSTLNRQASRRGVTPSTEILEDLLRSRRELEVGQLPVLRLGGGGSPAWGEVAAGSDHTSARLNATRAFLRRGRFSIGRVGEAPRLIRPFSDFMRDEDFDSSYENLLRLETLIGDARPRRTDEATLKAMPKGKYAEWKREGSDERCPICLDDYAPDDDLLKVPSCNHWLHQGCLEQWLQSASTCPVCRGRVGNNATASGSSARTQATSRVTMRRDTLYRRAMYTPPEDIERAQAGRRSDPAGPRRSVPRTTVPPTRPPASTSMPSGPPTSSTRLPPPPPPPWAVRMRPPHRMSRQSEPIDLTLDMSDEEGTDVEFMIPPWTGRRSSTNRGDGSTTSGPSTSTPNATEAAPAPSTYIPTPAFIPVTALPTPSSPTTPSVPVELPDIEPPAPASAPADWTPDGMDVDSDDDLYF